MSADHGPFRRWFVRLSILFLLGAAGFGVYRLQHVRAEVTVPNASVRKGDFLVLVRACGALRARRSVGVYSPSVPNLRIAWLATAGETVKQDDVILRFDSSTAQQQLLQKESQLKQADAALEQALAQSKTSVQQDATELADANFSRERAQVQVDLQSIVSRIKGEQSKIDLGIAEQKLKVQEATVALHRASEASRIASLTRQRDQVKTDVEITRSRIADMVVKAPITGLFTLRTNCAAAITSTSECKPYKVGDNVSSAMLLGQLPDLESMELEARLEEADRGRVASGQDVIVRVDAMPAMAIAAKVREVSPLAEMSTDYPYNRSFRAYASIQHPDSRLRPDMNGGLDIIVRRIPNALSIPSKALFTRGGKPVLYLAEGGRYRPVEVEVQARNPDEVAVSGIPEGSVVALLDLEKQGNKK